MFILKVHTIAIYVIGITKQASIILFAFALFDLTIPRIVVITFSNADTI